MSIHIQGCDAGFIAWKYVLMLLICIIHSMFTFSLSASTGCTSKYTRRFAEARSYFAAWQVASYLRCHQSDSLLWQTSGYPYHTHRHFTIFPEHFLFTPQAALHVKLKWHKLTVSHYEDHMMRSEAESKRRARYLFIVSLRSTVKLHKCHLLNLSLGNVCFVYRVSGKSDYKQAQIKSHRRKSKFNRRLIEHNAARPLPHCSVADW